MLSEQDIDRLQALYELDRQGSLSALLGEVVAEMRARGVGRQRDPTRTPLVAPWQSLFEFFYQPPSPPTREEIIYALFPSERMRIADQALGMRGYEGRAKREGG
jgi:hypothetical protein